MILVLEFLRTKLGQYILVGASAVAALLVFVGHERSVGVKKERARVEQQGAKTDAKAADRRRAAEREPDGVLGRYYRD